MFNGFTDATIDFFIDLKFHNTTPFFHENHDLPRPFSTKTMIAMWKPSNHPSTR